MEFPAKILLFGEYGILLGSMGLAIPYPRFSGRLRFFEEPGNIPSAREIASNGELVRLLDWIKRNPSCFPFLDLARFESDAATGLYFDSTIPQGSGLGSSGAVTAAIYNRYANDRYQKVLHRIKSDLAAMEGYAHGQSSGMDPVISLARKPILVNRRPTEIEVVDISPFLEAYTLFLIDSHSQGKTKDLVGGFLENYDKSDFRHLIDNEYIPIINEATEAVLASDFESFGSAISKYSRIQLTHLPHLIPAGMRKFFEHGIESGEFHLKICGSGGGGYILGFARDRLLAENYFKENHLDFSIV